MKKNKSNMKKYRVMCVLLTAIMMVPQMLWAEQVDAQAAQTIAQQFMQVHSSGRMMAPSPRMILTHAEPATARMAAVDYYVFNAVDGKSFVIVSGDDRAEGILAYGDGTLDMTDIPCNLQSMLDYYKEQMEYLHSHPGLQVQRGAPSLAASQVRYLPLLTCDWSQGRPYNDQCPEYTNGERCVTGCVATAMAQVMYYWRYPAQAPSVPSLRLSWTTLPVLPSTTFHWDDMLDVYTGNYTPAQADAVSTLMRYCGQASSMDYGVDGSGTQVRCQNEAVKLMGYTHSSMLNRSSYSKDRWLSIMLNELENGRPILFSGSGQDGGHAYVLDGYDGEMDKFHINWGWASRGNGYFALDAFNVEGMTFNSSQQMLINVYPSSTPKPADQYDFEAGGICYRYGDNAGEAVVACRTDAFDSYHGNVVVPSQVTVGGRTMTVTRIGKSAFRDCDNLVTVTLPATIKHIDAYAFRTCSSLTTVNLPAGLETIGDQAFTNCVSLESVYISSSVREIGYKSFLNCTGLNRVEIDDIQSWIDLRLDGQYSNPLLYGHRLYCGGQEIKHLVLPSTLTTVPDYKFLGFSGMTSLTLPEGLTAIGHSSFAGCSSLSGVELPSTLTTIGIEAFKECTGLQHLVLPPAVTRIGNRAFEGCHGMTGVGFTMPVATIGTDAFNGCTSLTRVEVPDLGTWLRNGFVSANSNPLKFAGHLYVDGVEMTDIVIPDDLDKVGDYAFYNFTAMTTVTMGKRLTSIGTAAFALCKGLKDVVIGDGVTSIGEKAFSTSSALESLTIGKSVTTIGDRAFFACTALNQVLCRSQEPPVASNVMWFSNSTCAQATLMVPEAAVVAYSKANEWKRFDHIVAVSIDDLPGDVNADGELTIADVNMLVDIILSGQHTRGSVDVNGDGEINLADVNSLIQMILLTY